MLNNEKAVNEKTVNEKTANKKTDGETGEIVEIVEIVETDLEAFPGIRIGQTENLQAGTGITVLLSEDPQGMAAGLHIAGGGPAVRETAILDPVTTARRIHAAVLGGGSAFGLDAAGGVMRYLEEKGIGVTVRDIRVPLVTQVDLFDLPVGDPHIRPDREMGYAACLLAEQGERGNFRCGNYGAGCGATIGKYAGGEHAMKSGIGSCLLRRGDLMVGAIIAVNAFGDIYDWKNGKKIAGAHADDGRLYDYREMITYLGKMEAMRMQAAAFNTTIGIVFTNARFEKPELCKIAAMAHDGFARSIAPVHTSGDGDSIIALSVNSQYNRQEKKAGQGEKLPNAVDSHKKTFPDTDIIAGIDTVGSLAAWAVSEAILRGVRSTSSAFGYPAVSDADCRQ